jgi:uncharacterized protein (TIGR02118 family)
MFLFRNGGIMFIVEVVYKRPADASDFDHRYFETHVPLVKLFPGLEGFDVSVGEVAGDDEVYLIATLRFASPQIGEAALSSRAAVESIENLDSFARGMYSVRSYETRSLL